MARAMAPGAATKLRFNEERALKVFRVVGQAWARRDGFYAGLISPQQRYTPEKIRSNPPALANWFFTLSIPMRGGINSDDAFRFMRAMHEVRPHLFSPEIVADTSESELASAIRETARRIHNGGNGSRGEKEAGTLSYKLEEHVRIWIQNAKTLIERWGSDARNIFWGVSGFEDAFRRVDSAKSNPADLAGMRRKIFSLLAMWLQEFRLIPKFPLPLIVDFHVMRVLLEHKIIIPQWERLGPGQPRIPERIRPEPLWDYPAVHAAEGFIDAIIAWSERFLRRHNLSAHDISHGLWFLSRELCASYFGNRSFTRQLPNKKRITERLVDPTVLTAPGGWPKTYRDPCALCPVESNCSIAIPNAPYYDWGVLVNAGPHVRYPGREPLLTGIKWQTMPGSFRSTKRRYD